MIMIPKILTLKKNKITNFAKERNILLKRSKSAWNLYLDNDEKVDDLEFKISNYFSAYKLIRKNYFLNQYVGEEKIIRLVKKGTGKWIRKVHEVFISKENVGLSSNIIIHKTASNLSEYIKKINYYSDLHAIENKKEGKKSSLIKIVFYPMGKFFVTLIKSKNVVFSIMQSLHSFLSWSKLYFLQY